MIKNRIGKSAPWCLTFLLVIMLPAFSFGQDPASGKPVPAPRPVEGSSKPSPPPRGSNVGVKTQQTKLTPGLKHDALVRKMGAETFEKGMNAPLTPSGERQAADAKRAVVKELKADLRMRVSAINKQKEKMRKGGLRARIGKAGRVNRDKLESLERSAQQTSKILSNLQEGSLSNAERRTIGSVAQSRGLEIKGVNIEKKQAKARANQLKSGLKAFNRAANMPKPAQPAKRPTIRRK